MNKTDLTLKELTLGWLNKSFRSHNQHRSATQVSPRCGPFLLVRLASTLDTELELAGPPSLIRAELLVLGGLRYPVKEAKVCGAQNFQ